MPSVEFIIDGMPVSAQTKNDALKAAYCKKVARVAQNAMAGSLPYVVPVRLDVKIFYVGGVKPDNDNVTKLLQDVFEGIIYANDRQIHDTVLMRRDIDEPFRMSGVSPLIAFALTGNTPFMYIRVTTEIDRAVIE
ncbi:RusA family crossover junction endodeoxyribonuclease [Streptosporangium sp. NPDC002524]|uniref:RusA family crossover junction endodeoxyribonuclease n=1 Tax=Streptosporangium sp. NPDC002524 TaxID=3154537 RepID=UPI00332E7751